MKKAFILSILLSSIFLSGCQEKSQDQACFNDQCFNIELATTVKKQSTDLMNHSSLDKDSGMLFTFINQKKHAIWMLNMNFPLDIIWLNKDKKVVHIEKNAQPCLDVTSCNLINPLEPSKYVLELNANIAQEIGLQIDDIMEIKNY